MYNIYIFVSFGVFLTTPLRVLKLRMEERPPGVEGTCEYTEVGVTDSRQGCSSSLGVGQDANSSSPYTSTTLRNTTQGPVFDKLAGASDAVMNLRVLYNAGIC
jgi:hypothetical protein